MSEEVKCPWCGGVINDLWNYGIDEDCAEEIDCPHDCGKKLIASKHVNIWYEVEKRVEDCEHKESFSKIYCSECAGDIRQLEKEPTHE